MKIVIEKNKEYAFQSFFMGLKQQAQSKRRLAKFDFLKIPKNIIDKTVSISGVRKEGYNQKQKKLHSEVKSFFDTLWRGKQKEVNYVFSLLKKHEGTINWIVKKVPSYTDLKWPFKEVFIYPNVMSWATKAGNYISVGITPKHFLEKDLVPVITHELIHVNTDMLKFENLKYPRDSSEMANTLITGKITRAMNEKFGTLIRNLKPAVTFRKYNEDWKYLKSLVKNTYDFKIVAGKIDSFLISKNHEKVYKK